MRSFRIIPITILSAGLLTAGNFTGIFDSSREFSTSSGKREDYRIMFYNVENLFDIYNNPEKEDDEFTPGGSRNWNRFRFREKLMNIYRVIVAAGEWEPPEIIGLSEVENSYVLEQLTLSTPLSGAGYEFVHRNSPDRRGIDVALLYRPEKFRLLKKDFYSVECEFDTLFKTREILYTKGVTLCSDTLHLFVNHWPSRWGGQAATEHRRIMAANVLRSAIDSVFETNRFARIIVMGDFNDEPHNKSISEVLGAGSDFSETCLSGLYNLFADFGRQGRGTLKFRGEWYLFDQIIVSGSLLGGAEGLSVRQGSVTIFDPPFLLVRDDSYFGYKPFRSYEGFRYTGGYSDHLPVYIDLQGEDLN